jgi:small subunit ribosomal protein S1
VTKVVTFGAFVEILPGVEGLVHISELAQHHVENPREVVSQGQDVKVLILEVDAERRRLSLSMKRVEGEEGEDGDEVSQLTPNLGLSEEVFAEGSTAPADATATEDAGPMEAEAADPETEPLAEAELEPVSVPDPEADESGTTS